MMEQPRKVDVPLPPQEYRWGCLQWAGAGCLILVILLALGGYFVCKKYVRPLYSGLTALIAECDAVAALTEAEARGRSDTTLSVDELEEDPAAYRGKFAIVRGIVESDGTTRFTFKSRSYRLFQLGGGTFVVATHDFGEVAYGDSVEVVGKVSDVDVAAVIDQIAPGAAEELIADHVVIFLAREVRRFDSRADEFQ